MEIIYQDFNQDFLGDNLEIGVILQELDNILNDMPLYLKASDQSGKQGTLIFDPVGTNEYLKTKLADFHWSTNVPIPKNLKFWGKEVDFVNQGILLEVQFSNYSYLVNNLLRTEIFFRGKTLFDEVACQFLIIITKGKIFPASNSTLYYEQAIQQIANLSNYKIFRIPIRVIGLVVAPNSTITSVISTYSQTRYSRQAIERYSKDVKVLTLGKTTQIYLES
jgi:hypothetical protein